jgi:hypothetical protein
LLTLEAWEEAHAVVESNLEGEGNDLRWAAAGYMTAAVPEDIGTESAEEPEEWGKEEGQGNTPLLQAGVAAVAAAAAHTAAVGTCPERMRAAVAAAAGAEAEATEQQPGGSSWLTQGMRGDTEAARNEVAGCTEAGEGERERALNTVHIGMAAPDSRQHMDSAGSPGASTSEEEAAGADRAGKAGGADDRSEQWQVLG